MSWKPIDTAPRNGVLIRVKEAGWPSSYHVRWWTRKMIEDEEWVGYDPGWYENFPEEDRDGDVIVAPDFWYDDQPI